MKKFLSIFVTIFIFIFLTYSYLSPGSKYLFERSTDIVLSDGTDQVPVPHTYNIILEHLKEKPSDFFYGALYTDRFNPPNGFVIWLSWAEKISIVALSPFLPVEQLNAGMSFCYIFLSGIFMFALGRYMKWSYWISLGLGIAWAFNAFSLARAKVHPGFDALFFLPMFFLAFQIIKEKASLFKNIIASLLLLFAATVSQYFIVISAFLSPFWLTYILFESPEKIKTLKKSLIIIFPAAILLIWTALMPVSPAIKHRVVDLYPKTGVSQTGIHPFMYDLSAQPIDYLSGNVGISADDFIDLKEDINLSILKNLTYKNSEHEHAVGIRWLIILLSIVPLYFIIFRKKEFSSSEKKQYLFFYALAIFSFYLSLSPLLFGMNIGPSLWLHKLVPQFRVPSRASVFVHFSLLMICGLFIQKIIENFKLSKIKLSFITLFFPLLILLELPPTHPLPTRLILPRNEALSDVKCGVGIYFPYVNGAYDPITYYNFLQTLRGSKCTPLNTISPQEPFDEKMLKKLAKHPIVFKAINDNNPALKKFFIHFVKCAPLEWIVFDKIVPPAWSKNVCDELGWNMSNEVTCHTTFQKTQVKKTFAECL